MNKKMHLVVVSLAILDLIGIGVCVSSNSNMTATAIYAFGDSIFDSGNNNGLPTICRADHPPYGSELPATAHFGRFSNGKLPGDILISDMGHKPMLPAYPSIFTPSPETGVSFASSCSGFDDLTATEAGVLSLNKQYHYFEEVRESMKRKMGSSETTKVLDNALFLVSGGTSDMLDNYYALPLRRLTYSLSAYHQLLLQNLGSFLKKLYKNDARRVGVLGLPPVGCLPKDITARSWFKRECVSEHNSDAQQYNNDLQQFIKKMAADMPQLKIAYVDIYNPMMDMINNPAKYGLEHTLEGCCGTGSWELGPLCSKYAPVCADPSKYLFWDAAHPTQAAYQILTKIFKEKTLSSLLSP